MPIKYCPEFNFGIHFHVRSLHVVLKGGNHWILVKNTFHYRWMQLDGLSNQYQVP
jgi:hypothetical protein